MENNLIDKKSYLNKQRLIDHSRSPLNYGLLERCDFSSGKQNPSCGDSIVVSGQLKDNRLNAIGFEGKGCMLSIAMASLLTEYVKGLSLQEILQLDELIVYKLLGIELGPNRMQCGMLSVQALQKGIKNYKS